MLGDRSRTRSRRRWRLADDGRRRAGIQLEEQATQLGRRARRRSRQWVTRAERSLNTRRKRLGRGLESVGLALERRSKALRRRDGLSATAGRIVYRAGTAVEDAGEFIRTHDLRELRQEAAALVRRRPFLVVVLAAGAGLAVGGALGSIRRRRAERRLAELRREALRAAEFRPGLLDRVLGRRGPALASRADPAIFRHGPGPRPRQKL